MKIVVTTGNLGVGKTTTVNMMMEELSKHGKSMFKTCFARNLKSAVKEHFGLYKGIDVQSHVPRPFSVAWECLLEDFMSAYQIHNLGPAGRAIPADCPEKELLRQAVGNADIRKALQIVGTDIVRKYLTPDYWANLVVKQLHVVAPYTDWAFVDDCRFINEANAIVNNFENYHIVAVQTSVENASERLGLTEEEYRAKLEHGSEAEVLSIPHTEAISNDRDYGDVRKAAAWFILTRK